MSKEAEAYADAILAHSKAIDDWMLKCSDMALAAMWGHVHLTRDLRNRLSTLRWIERESR